MENKQFYENLYGRLEDDLTAIEMNEHSQADNENSAWSKPWLLQGTSKPW